MYGCSLLYRTITLNSQTIDVNAFYIRMVLLERTKKKKQKYVHLQDENLCISAPVNLNRSDGFLNNHFQFHLSLGTVSKVMKWTEYADDNYAHKKMIRRQPHSVFRSSKLSSKSN